MTKTLDNQIVSLSLTYDQLCLILSQKTERPESKKKISNRQFLYSVFSSRRGGMKGVRLHSAKNRLNTINYTKFSPPDLSVWLKTIVI